jgi:hypothetical protein
MKLLVARPYLSLFDVTPSYSHCSGRQLKITRDRGSARRRAALVA